MVMIPGSGSARSGTAAPPTVDDPLGWDFGSGGRLVENRRQQRIIARMRLLRAEGLSYRVIATRLDAEGIRPKLGRRWIHTTVKSILTRNAA
jgi:hypothetical protein